VSAKKRQDVADIDPVVVSRAMRDIDRVLRSVAAKQVTLTFVGESGVGKEVLARRAHALSDRRRGPFVPINCAAIPETLFESELFGHERGAFTGASAQARGKVEAAADGTLFLDEIGEMPPPMQAKILRFIEHRRFMRVGGTTKIEADVRLMCATLRPLEEEVEAGRFRADLYYRIQGITLPVPPLRTRRDDIPPLIDQFVAQMAARHQVVAPRISRPARAALLGHDWPGNVRELRNLVENLCLLRAGRPVRVRDLPAPLRGPAAPAPASRSLTLTLDEDLGTLVDRIVAAALALERGDKARAAARLGISLRTIQRHVANGRVTAPSVDTPADAAPASPARTRTRTPAARPPRTPAP
jgi:transcriptional regulator with PAS, ATPase and Fis domain